MMPSILSKLFKSQLHRGWHIGIDASADDIKFTCLKKDVDNVDSYVLTAYGRIPWDKSQIESVLRAMGGGVGSIRVNMNDPSLRVRRWVIPKVPDKERAEVIRWSLEGVVDGSVEDYVVRYQKLPVVAPEESKEVYLVFTIARDAVLRQLAKLKDVGILRPEILEPDASGLRMCYAYHCDLSPGVQNVLVDVGKHQLNVLVVGKHVLFFSRSLTGFSADALTRQISRNLGVDMAKAEELKLQYVSTTQLGGVPSAMDIRLANTISHFMSKFCIELERTLDAYRVDFPDQHVQAISFIGGGSLLSGLIEQVCAAVKLPLKPFSPFQRFQKGIFKSEELDNHSPWYGVACGLAL